MQKEWDGYAVAGRRADFFSRYLCKAWYCVTASHPPRGSIYIMAVICDRQVDCMSAGWLLACLLDLVGRYM